MSRAFKVSWTNEHQAPHTPSMVELFHWLRLQIAPTADTRANDNNFQPERTCHGFKRLAATRVTRCRENKTENGGKKKKIGTPGTDLCVRAGPKNGAAEIYLDTGHKGQNRGPSRANWEVWSPSIEGTQSFGKAYIYI